MNKKFISLIMAALLAVSAAAVSASAVETDEKTAGAEVSAETAADEDKKTFFFDSGNWNSQSINFYIWDTTKGDYATGNNGWVSDNTWGSRKKLGGKAVDGKPGVFESYEVDFSGRENDAIYVIFHDLDSNAQTFDAIINSSVIGTTASKSHIIYENPADSDKTAEGVQFDGGNGIGVAKVITSTGKIQGDIISPTLDRADIVAQFVLNYLGTKDDNGNDVVTPQSTANAISAFGTTENDVWSAYQLYSADERYNEEEGKKVIKSGIQPQLGGILGDVDGSGKIDSQDALSILRASVKLETFDDEKTKLADVDGDKQLTSADSLAVLRYSVHLSTEYPIGQPIQ